MMRMILAAMVLLMSSVAWADEPQAQGKDELTKVIVELYKVRLEAAKADLALDKATLRRKADIYDTCRYLTQHNAIPAQQTHDARLALDKAIIDVRCSEVAVREAELLLKLVELGVKHGHIRPSDLHHHLHERSRRDR